MRKDNVHGTVAWQPLVVETVASPAALRERIQRQHDATMQKLGERLVQLGLITEEQLGHALRLQGANARRHLGQVLLALDYVSEAHLTQVVCDQLGIAAVDLARFPVDAAALRLLPEKTARRYGMVPLCCIGGQLFLAMSDPLDQEALEDARFFAQMSVVPVTALRRDVEHAIAALYDGIAYPRSEAPPPAPRVEEPRNVYKIGPIRASEEDRTAVAALNDETFFARAA